MGKLPLGQSICSRLSAKAKQCSTGKRKMDLNATYLSLVTGQLDSSLPKWLGAQANKHIDNILEIDLIFDING